MVVSVFADVLLFVPRQLGYDGFEERRSARNYACILELDTFLTR